MDDLTNLYDDAWSPAPAVEGEDANLYDSLTSTLSGKRDALVRELDKGVTPDAFKQGQALLGAYNAALAGLEKARARG